MKKFLAATAYLLTILAVPAYAADDAKAASVAAVEPEFTIIAGDVLQIAVWKEDGMDREVLVLPDGSITYPLIGTIKAQGMTPVQLQNEIKHKLAKIIPQASVSVSVKAALGHVVSVIGQVAKPGEFVISRRLTAVQALSQAGGLTPYASEGSIRVIRHEGGEEQAIEIPYSDIIKGDDLDKDIALRPGDVVVVPTARLF